MRVQDCYGSVYRLIEESASYFILASLGDGRPFVKSKDGCTVLPDVRWRNVTNQCEYDGYCSLIHRGASGPIIVSAQMGYRVRWILLREDNGRGVFSGESAFIVEKSE